MARIQILELPMQEGDDGKVVTPFLLIVDEYTGPTDVFTVEAWNELAKRCGARHIFLTPERIDLVGPTPEEIAACSQKVGEDEVTDAPQSDALTEFVNGFRQTVAKFVASAAKNEPEAGP